jgi:hypothetical protein
MTTATAVSEETVNVLLIGGSSAGRVVSLGAEPPSVVAVACFPDPEDYFDSDDHFTASAMEQYLVCEFFVNGQSGYVGVPQKWGTTDDWSEKLRGRIEALVVEHLRDLRKR